MVQESSRRRDWIVERTQRILSVCCTAPVTRTLGTVAVGTMMLTTAACASAQTSEGEAPVPSATATSAPATSVAERPKVLEDMLADLEQLEEAFVPGTTLAPADAEIARFRLDRLTGDLTESLAGPLGEAHGYELRMAMGRALALSATLGRPGTDALAVAMFKRASDLAAERAAPRVRQASLLVAMGRHNRALDVIAAARECDDAATQPDIDLVAALAHYGAGDYQAARRLLDAHLEKSAASPRAERLARALEADPSTSSDGEISLGVEGRSMVRYEVRGATWRMVHETLGFEIGLPLSWQMVDEQIDADDGGFVRISAPPVTGANRQWRSDTVTIWAIPVTDETDVTALKDAWLESYDDVGTVEPLASLGLPRATRMRVHRTPYMDDPLVGEAVVMVDDGTGYVIEFWGDDVSFLQSEGQLVEILRGFKLLDTESSG